MIRKILKALMPVALRDFYIKMMILNKNKKIMYHHFCARKSKDVISNYPFFEISQPHHHCFFGYYDINPFNTDSTKVLNLCTKGNLDWATINIYDIKNVTNIPITVTRVWNWQQGCRLRWHPKDENLIIYNDFAEGNYCTRFFNVKEKKIVKTLDYPLYDVDNECKLGLSLNFARLGAKRPSYGYVSYPFHEDNSDMEGVDLIDIENNTSRRLFTFREIERYLVGKKGGFNNYYLNHISFSPSATRFLFFFLDSSTSRHEAYMMVYDLKSDKVIPLEIKDKVSHYVWNGDNEIIATVYDDAMNCGYYIYNVEGGLRTKYNTINKDGHPSIFTKDTILTDTYPNKDCYQDLYIADKKGKKINLASLFSYPLMFGEKRTDLHPRLNKEHSMVCVDANSRGYRRMLVFKIDDHIS